MALSDWQSEICLAALPEYIKGRVVNVEDAVSVINELESETQPSYVLFESPKDACTVVKNGANLTSVNVGGMHSSKGKREILDFIYVNDSDVNYLKELQDREIKLDFRDIPNHENVDVMSRL